MSHLLRCLLLLCLGLALPMRAQDTLSDAPLTPPQVDQLLGPIALYPDALIALILPASTTPGDIVLAQRYLAAGGDPGQVDNQPWNESVRALARYPMLIKWLDENLTWTQQLGQTFISQPDEVMNAVQRLRARAKASGALTSTAQQKLVFDGDVIEIVPAQPDVIYVPYYDPNVVYGGLPPGYFYGGPYLTFGIGMPVGFWLCYDFNWHQRTVWVGDRHHNWREYGRGDWSHRYGEPGHSNSNWRRWQPPANRPPYARPPGHSTRSDYYRPSPFPGGPSYPPHDARPHGNAPRPDSSDHRDGRDRPEPRPAPAPVAPPNTPRPDMGNRGAPHPTPTPSPAPSYPRTDGSNHRDHHDPRPSPMPAPNTPRPDRPPGPPVPNQPAPVPPPHTDRGNPPAQPRPEMHGPPGGNVPPQGNHPPHQFNPPPPPPPPVRTAPPPPPKDRSRDQDPQVAR